MNLLFTLMNYNCQTCKAKLSMATFSDLSLTISEPYIFFHNAGLAAGLYSGLTYGLKEARGAHDWVMF